MTAAAPTPRILFVGHVVLDFIMMVDEMPRVAEKYRARDARVVAGGCATNAAVAAARLGAAVRLCARLGDDVMADLVCANLAEEGIGSDGLRRLPGCHSGFSNILVDAKGERQIVSFRDRNLPDDVDWLAPWFDGECDAIMTDSRWPKGAAAAMAAARRLDLPGVIDAEAPLEGCDEALAAASHVAFSAQGLRDWAGTEEIPAALAEASAELPGVVTVTDGAEGVYWIEGGTVQQLRPPATQVVDTMGAGDVWHGAFTLALVDRDLAAKGDLGRQFEVANTAAALRCEGRGSPTRAQLLERLAR